MVTDRQVRRLRMELGKGESLSSAALRSGMSENTARRHRSGELPGQRKSPRQYRTRPDPFVRVWPEIEAMLERRRAGEVPGRARCQPILRGIRTARPVPAEAPTVLSQLL
jgi:hypothetical protein